MKQYPLGRIPSPVDERDWQLKTFINTSDFDETITFKKWDFPAEEPLNQGESPHCVGFSGANWGINLPIHTPFTNEDGHKFYYECKKIENQQGMENGAFVRSIAKVLKNNGHLEYYAFAHTPEEIKLWVLNRGPAIVGTIWTKGMFEADENNIIHPTGKMLGGHAYIINEVTEDGYFGIQNSWGSSWGNNGHAYISIEDFETIFKDGGEAVAAVEIEKKKKECWIISWLKSFFS